MGERGARVSVHTLSCFPVADFGSERQQRDLLPQMGDLLGAYCLFERHASSDPSAMREAGRAGRDGRLDGRR